MRILFIEDDDEKQSKVLEFVGKRFPLASIEVAKSFGTGLKSLVKNSKELDLVLLDMSMPNYDSSAESNAIKTPENFAGRDLLAQMNLRKIFLPTIVITQFDSFGDAPNKLSLEQLGDQLSRNYDPMFRGIVHYSSAHNAWMDSLSLLISQVKK